MLTPERIHTAAARAAPYVLRTPVIPAGEETWLKLECFQPTGSFKVRGFFAAALALPKARLARGLMTVSAGNAALAAAYVAHRLGVPCRVVMFETAPKPKIEGVRRWGAIPLLRPRQEVLAWLEERRWEAEPETFIHPFADEELMAGHGGIGLELLEQIQGLRRVVIPVGGGGLIAGIASALKAARAEIEIVGVQSDGYALWPRAIAAGGRPAPLTPNTIADGTTAPYDGAMHERLRLAVDRWIEAPETQLRETVSALAQSSRIVAEGAGALAFAALSQLPQGSPTVAVVSSGNIAPTLLAQLPSGSESTAKS